MPAHVPETQKGAGGAPLSATACVNVCASVHPGLEGLTGRTWNSSSYSKQVCWALWKVMSDILRSAVDLGGIKCMAPEMVIGDGPSGWLTV